MARRNTRTLERPTTVAVPERISKRTLALWMPIVLMALLGLGTLIALAILPDNATPAVQPEQQIETGMEEIVPPVDENPPAQGAEPGQQETTDGNSQPVIVPLEDPGIPFIAVTWQLKPQGMPFPPTEGGFYDGSVFTNPKTMEGVAFHEEDALYVMGILPWLGKLLDIENHGILAAISRDPNSGAVFVATHFRAGGELVPLEEREKSPDMPGYEFSRYFVSVDGEQSWYELSTILVEAPCSPRCTGRTFSNTRVKLENGLVHLFVMDSGLPSKWYYATLELTSLPR